jgi:hypothetical protein
MTARTIIEAERRANLERFEQTFATLEGVAEEHLTTLRRATTTTASRSYYPQSEARSARPPTLPPLCADSRRPWPHCKEAKEPQRSRRKQGK